MYRPGGIRQIAVCIRGMENRKCVVGFMRDNILRIAVAHAVKGHPEDIRAEILALAVFLFHAMPPGLHNSRSLTLLLYFM